MKFLTVIQHTSADYLGLMEDHLEGRKIGFSYVRPFTDGTAVPTFDDIADGLILLGGGPWGSAGSRDVPTLEKEVSLTRACLMHGLPVIGIGLGSQILAIAADGKSEARELRFTIETGRRVQADALNGYLPEEFPAITYMRDIPVPPDYAQVLAVDHSQHPLIYQIGESTFGFSCQPGFKLAMAEDLIMEFAESPPETSRNLQKLGSTKTAIEEALIPIMTGLIQKTGLMTE